MPSPTRYMRSDTHTVNTLLAYILGTTQSAIFQSATDLAAGAKSCSWGIRVWKIDTAGVETEITSGTPVAQVSRFINGSGLQSNIWSCPATILAATDAIVVRVYHNLGGAGWILDATFVTEQLGVVLLNSATWTVYYWTFWQYVGPPLFSTSIAFYWGVSTYNSRIEGLKYGEAEAIPMGDGLSWVH